MDTGFKHNSAIVYKFGYMTALAVLPWSVWVASYCIGAMALGGLFSSDIREKIHRFIQNPRAIIFIALFFLYILGLFYTSDITSGIATIEQKLSLLIFPLITVTSFTLTNKDRKQILIAFAISLLIFTLCCFGYNLYLVLRGFPYMQLNFDPHTLTKFNEFHANVNPAWLRFSYIAFSNSLIGPTYLSLYLVLSILIFFYYPPDSFLKKAIRFFSITWFSVAIILLASRMGIFLFVLITMLNLLYYAYHKQYSFLKTLTLSGSLIALVFVLTLLFPVTRFRLIEEPLSTPLSLPTNANAWNSVNLRFLEWASGIKSIEENGIAGTGTGGTLSALHSHYQKVNLGDFENNYDAHNQYIETYIEIGLPGFIILLACFIIPAFYAIKNKNTLLLSVALMTGIAGFSTCVFERTRGIIFYMSFISLFMFTKTNQEENEYFK